MGLCGTKAEPVDIDDSTNNEQAQANAHIEETMSRENDADKRVIKVLLLGERHDHRLRNLCTLHLDCIS